MTPGPPLETPISSRACAAACLRFLSDAGVDVTLGTEPVDRMNLVTPAAAPAPAQPSNAYTGSAPETRRPPNSAAPARSRLEEIGKAEALAAAAQSLPDLKAALEAFDGCALKETATHLVFADGPENADLMLIGEAPGRDEDLAGKPFVGASGQLLDRILEAGGLPRSSVYITNVMPWRPPGNRKPTPLETQIMMPFLKRHIALKSPKALLLLGGTPATALSGKTEGITRLRGKWIDVDAKDGPALKALPTFHPAYLLRQPAHKAFVWSDILAMREHLGA